MAKNKQLLGNFGVFYIATELSKNGIITTITSRNTEKIDILASNANGTKAVTIQVKTRRGKDFPIASYSEEPKSRSEGEELIKNTVCPSPNKFYAFVSVDENDDVKDYYITPSVEVLQGVLADRNAYLSKGASKRTGQPLKDSGVWTWEPNEKYKRNLKLIEDALHDDSPTK